MSQILRLLEQNYPEAECSLTFKNPYQLLVATILSAQCTDERVNKVTPALFKRFPGAREMAQADLAEIEELIRTTGFFRNKALSILETSRALIENHGGKVPQNLDQLVALRGVGRKTANVVLGVAYGVPGLVVDTHVGRLSRRMGFTPEMDPIKVEHRMMEIVPREMWTPYAHLLIDHGRAICTARKAMCSECPIVRFCPKIGVA
jgi:endonuclease-3